MSGSSSRAPTPRVLFDYAGHQARSQIGRLLARLIGSLMVVVGLTATVIAIPTGLVTMADIVTTWQGEHDETFSADFPLREVEAAFVAATAAAIAGLKYGRRLVRGHRSIVLFLRRFGYDGSMQVVTYAVANTIGASWRLVTLDDDEIAPMGVDAASRTVFQAGEGLARFAGAAGKAILASFQWTTGTMWAVVAVQAVLVARDWQHFNPKLLDPYVAIFASVMERHIPVDYFGWSLPGVFALAATGVALSFVGLLVMMAVLLAMLPLFGFVIFATSSADALRKAEAKKRETIKSAGDIREITSELSRLGRQTFAPRLVVLRVATAAWRQTVSALAGVAAVTIVDISEPTDNLVWEIGELQRLGVRDRCIFIGDHARLAHWPDGSAPSSTSPEACVVSSIGDRPVLAYTSDRKGMRRFAQALYGMLLDVPGPPMH